MSDQNDELKAFSFDEEIESATARTIDISLCAPSDELSDSSASNSSLQGAVSDASPATPLDQSSELNALGSAVTEAAVKEALLRKGTYKDPIPQITSPDRLIDFVNKSRRVTVEKLDAHMVNESYPIMLWKMREFAVQGKYTETRAIEIWLNWAQKVMSRPKREKRDPSVASGAAFDARLTKGAVIDLEPEKKSRARSGHFSTAGEFIGKIKKPKKEKA